jgi:hypothetical protein
MATLYLSAPDKATMDAALLEWGFVDADGNSVSRTNVWTVGTIWATEPTYDAEGNTLTAGTPVAGYHVNIVCENPALRDVCEALSAAEPGETLTLNGITSCWPVTPSLVVE